MCEYCRKYTDNSINGMGFLIPPNEANKNNPHIYALSGKIIKTENDAKAGLFIIDTFGYHLIDINYCPFCGRKLVEEQCG